MVETIAKKDTAFGPKIQFVIVGANKHTHRPWENCNHDFDERVIHEVICHLWWGWKSVDEISSSKKRFIPILGIKPEERREG